MEYRVLGNTGVQVSKLCLGGITFGRFTSEEYVIGIVRTALDHGINFIDTEDAYSLGFSEELVGKAVKGVRQKVIIATKFGRRIHDGPNESGASRLYVFKAIERSLRRLQVDYIDVYQMNRVDPETPIEETLEALSILISQGKVLYAGCCDLALWRVVDSLYVAEKARLKPFRTVQWPLNLLDRRFEEDAATSAKRYELAVLTYHPLSGGWLTGKYHAGEQPPPGSRGAFFGWQMDGDMILKRSEVIGRLSTLAAESGISLSELALRWVLSHGYVTSALIGPRTLDQLGGYLASADAPLPADLLLAIDKVVPPGSWL